LTTLTIFIHGINSDKKIWSTFIEVLTDDIKTCSVKQYTPGTTKVSEDIPYYYLHYYKSKIVENSLKGWIKENITGTKRSGSIPINSHAKTLKTLFLSNSEKFNSINIVAHSLGGIITMKTLLMLENETEIIEKIGKIILYGVPLNGSDDPNKLKKILGKRIPTAILKELAPNSLTLTGLRQRIEENYKFLKNNFNILYIKGDGDSRIREVEDEYIKKFGESQSIQGGHSEIIKPENSSSPSFTLFKSFIYSLDHNSKKNENKNYQSIIDKCTDTIIIRDWLIDYKDPLVKTIIENILNTQKKYTKELNKHDKKEIFQNSVDQHLEWLIGMFKHGTITEERKDYVGHTELLYSCKEAYLDSFVFLRNFIRHNKTSYDLNEEEVTLLLGGIDILIEKYS